MQRRSQATPGRLISVNLVYANLAVREVNGIDLRMHYETALPFGAVSVDVEATKLSSYEVTPSPVDDAVDLLDGDLYPDRRATISARWTREGITANYVWRFVGANGGYSSHHTSDLIGVYLTPWNGEITAGVRNVFDEMPPAHDDGGWDDSAIEIYDVTGRVPFIKYRHSF